MSLNPLHHSTDSRGSHFPSGPGVPADVLSPRGLRIGDAERQTVAQLLADHYAGGRLSLDEFSARQDAALTAITDRQLAMLLADLPVARTSPYYVAPNTSSSGALVSGVLLTLGAVVLGLMMLVTLGLVSTSQTREVAILLVGCTMFGVMGWIFALVHTLAKYHGRDGTSRR